MSFVVVCLDVFDNKALPVQRQRDNLVAPHHGFQSSHAEQIVVHPS